MVDAHPTDRRWGLVVCAAGKSVKLVPVITTTQPAGPLLGENEVMVGTAALAFGITQSMKTASRDRDQDSSHDSLHA
jgi:hypothetical protein